MTASSSSFDAGIAGSLDPAPGDHPVPRLLGGHFAAAASHDPSSSATDHRERLLVEASQQQDHDAYRQVVELHQDKIFRFCLHWLDGSDEDAHEVCQDTFVKAYLALPGFRFRRKTQFSTWLFRIALNLCRDRLRSAHHRRQQITDPVEENGKSVAESRNSRSGLPRCPLSPPDESLSLREDLQKLQCGLDALPGRLREALLLSTMEDLSYRQCAKILRCTERAVEGRVRRARMRLIEWWQHHP